MHTTVPSLIAQLVASMIADTGVLSLMPVRPDTFMETDHGIFSMVILLLPLIQEGLLSVTSESMCTEYWFTAWSKLAQVKKCD